MKPSIPHHQQISEERRTSPEKYPLAIQLRRSSPRDLQERDARVLVYIQRRQWPSQHLQGFAGGDPGYCSSVKGFDKRFSGKSVLFFTP